MLSTTKECPDRTCVLSYRFVETCFIYTKPVDRPTCDIPCDVRDCHLDVFHEMNCPIWDCVPHTTTTSTTTVSPDPGPHPSPVPPTQPACSTPACIAASSASGGLGLLMIILLLLFLRKRNAVNELRQRLSVYERLDPERLPILRERLDPERAPILRTRSQRATNFFTSRRSREPEPDRISFENIPLRVPPSAPSRSPSTQSSPV